MLALCGHNLEVSIVVNTNRPQNDIARLKFVIQALTPRIINVDYRRPAIKKIVKKQLCFCCKIAVHISMPVKMIAAEVGEYRDIDSQFMQAHLVKAMAGCLKGGMGHPAFS